MINPKDYPVSFVVPVYNESAGIEAFHESLITEIKNADLSLYEVIYVNDGSTDGTYDKLKVLAGHNKFVRILSLSRNFGKETSTTAGIARARGQAVIILDGDGQHPVELIPKFLERWRSGSKVVIGVRTSNQEEGLVKRWGSRLFYKLFNRFSGMKLVPGSTDFRLIDHEVQVEFARMTEHNRITRGLIDWLGYKRDYIEFRSNPRMAGEATYSFRKLFKLALDSTISLSISPLYISAYIGAVVLPLSLIIGLFMLVDVVFGDPLGLHATGSAYVIVFLLFLVGVLLVSQGIIGLYLSHIHTETQNRPLYIVDKSKSRGVE